MAGKAATNGFGRIGRSVLRTLVESGRNDVDGVAINAHLLKHDSVHGRLDPEVEVDGNTLLVGGLEIHVSAERNPSKLAWQDVDVAQECTGLFTKRESAIQHLGNGSKKVLVSTPATGAGKTIMYGVNLKSLTGQEVVVSNASCTTTYLSPVAKVLDDAFGSKRAT